MKDKICDFFVCALSEAPKSRWRNAEGAFLTLRYRPSVNVVVVMAKRMEKEKMKTLKNCLLGLYLLLQSPSGVFASLTLLAITIVTLKVPAVGGTAFAAFCAIIPGLITWAEHKEQLQMNQIQTQINVSNTPPNPGA